MHKHDWGPAQFLFLKPAFIFQTLPSTQQPKPEDAIQSDSIDPDPILALTGTTSDYLTDTETPEAEEGDAQPSPSSREGPVLKRSESWLGSRQRAALVSQLPVTERPFSAGGASPGWLEEASSPLEISEPSDRTRSFTKQEGVTSPKEPQNMVSPTFNYMKQDGTSISIQ